MKDQFQNPAAWQKAEELIEQAYSTGATELSLSGLRLRSLPESITKLSQLESLDLSGCRSLTKLIDFSNLIHLKHLNLSHCRGLTELGHLSQLTSLQHLDLIYCSNLSRLEGLSQKHSLQRLTLGGCRNLTDLSNLFELQNLQHLSLRIFKSLTELSALSHLQSLYRLNLSGCQSLTNLFGLSKLQSLQHLTLSGCQNLTNLGGLSELQNLQHLTLNNCENLTNLDNLSELQNLQHLTLTNCENLTNLDDLSELHNLQHLTLTNCKNLTNLDGLSELQNLQHLTLTDCKNLTCLDNLSRLQNLQYLTLAGCQNLTNLDDLLQLTSLQYLNLSSCQSLNSLDNLSQLTSLQHLNLADCQNLTNLDELPQLTRLQHLNLTGYQGLDRLDNLSQLTSLQHLNLTGCENLTNLDGLSQLTSLQRLSLSSCENLISLGDLSQLTSLQRLNLRYCQSLANLGDLSQLKSIELIDLRGCKNLTNLDRLSKLKSLERLDLSGCKNLTNLDGLPKLKNLESLDLSRCKKLINIGDLSQLTSMKHLNLSGCSPLINLSNIVLPINLRSLDVSGELPFKLLENIIKQLPYISSCYSNNVTVEFVPAELTKEFDLSTLEDWYHEIQKGYIQQNKIKLHFLGNGRIGKSQLSRSLLGKDYDESLPSTHAIKVDSWGAKVSDEQSIEVTNWDFGGQDVYLSTHSLFLDEQAVYCLVWHPDYENNEQTVENGVVMQNHHLSYWLSYIHSLSGPTPPIIVTQSRCDELSNYQSPPIPNSHPFAHLRIAETSAKTGNGLGVYRENLYQAIRTQLVSNGEVKLPKSWEYVSEKLKQLKDLGNKTVEFDHYLRLCEEDDEQKVSSPKALLVYLHNSGQIFYKEYLFDNALILDQSWALQGVYSLLEREKTLPIIRQQNGRFSRELISQLLWSDKGYSEDEQTLFLGMMEQCGVCFSIGEAQYITPDSLPERKNVSSQIESVWRNNDPDVHVKLSYKFLHLAVARNLLCKIGERAGQYATYWKYGCCYYDQKSGTCVLVSMDFHKGEQLENFEQPGSISIKLSGANSTELAKHLVDSILACKTFSKDPEVNWIQKDERATDKPDQLGGNNKSEPDFSQMPLAGKLPNVYMSYAWGKQDEHHEEVSNNIYNSLKQERGFTVIRDKEELSAGDSVQTFEELIGWSNHIIVIISKKYLQSEDCMRELAYIYKTSKDNEHFQRKVIPIVLNEVDITQSEKRLDYAEHWQKQHKKLKKRSKNISDATLTTSINLYADIKNSLFSSLSWCNDIVLDRNQTALEAENYQTIISLLRRKIKETEALADN